MENQTSLFKGELMEELLRNYFHNLGYYVVRGIKYKYENFDITDVDLYLYGRSSSLTRIRINVDIKNKKSPQAFERILWANGLKDLLCFDSCIVATTDTRPVIHSFGQLHKTTILDGNFLNKLRSNATLERISEEDLLNDLSINKSYKTYSNSSWKSIYEMSKSRLLSEQDFSGFNSTVTTLKYFIEKSITDEQKRCLCFRMIYLTLSHLLIIIDYILKDIAFLEQSEKEKRLSDGFKFGNLGKEGVDKIVNMAALISGKGVNSLYKQIDSIPTDILKEFFSKNDIAKNLFHWARELEQLSFKKTLIHPNQLDSYLKGLISVFLDFYMIERKKFFELEISNNGC